MKITLKIIGIVAFFSLVAYILTYPYELAHKGTEDIILIEESYEYTSLEQVINRPEFKDKVLYIKVWEPFSGEYLPYTKKELDTSTVYFNWNNKDSNKVNGKLDFTLPKKGKIVKYFDFEHQYKLFSELTNKYKNKDIAFISLANPDSDLETKSDDLRKWKMAIKKHQIKGYHFIMNPKLCQKIRTQISEITNNRFLPFHIIVDKEGQIVNFNAPWENSKEVLSLTLNKYLDN
jgi:hypothetical protein